MKYSLAFTSLQFLILITPIFAHTWVETVNLVGSDGSFQNTGFARGFGGRVAGVDPDKTNTYLLPPNGRGAGNEILPTDLICKDTQVNQVQSAGHPRLSASPNDLVSLAYHENGHVTKFDTTDGKPEGRGTVFIYGTNNPSPKDTYLGIHKIWNEDGTGGDKRGKLLATRPFDDGRCYQPNSESTAQTRAKALGFANAAESPEVLCQAAVQLPSDAGSNGTYTLYWVWDWPTLDQAGNIFKNESYTSCIDIDMQSKTASPTSQTVSANKVSENQGDKACVQNKVKKVNSKIAAANNSSKSRISQEKVTKEALDKKINYKESKREEATDKSPVSECKADGKDSVSTGSANSSKSDEGKAFSATGVMTAKNGKDKANTVAVKDQLEAKGQIMVDPNAPPKIASDNPPKNPGSSTSPPKGDKNSTKNAIPPNKTLQRVKGKKIISEDEENGDEKKVKKEKKVKENLPSNSLSISNSTENGNKNYMKNTTTPKQILQKVQGKNFTSEDKEKEEEKKKINENDDLPSSSLSISDSTEISNKNATENATPFEKVDIKVTEKISTSEEEENLPSNALPISRVMRNKVYIFAGNTSNVDLIRTITLP
ncbi:hypothetical protein EPUL_006840, partial [Erysiphe pulchra]